MGEVPKDFDLGEADVGDDASQPANTFTQVMSVVGKYQATANRARLHDLAVCDGLHQGVTARSMVSNGEIRIECYMCSCGLLTPCAWGIRLKLSKDGTSNRAVEPCATGRDTCDIVRHFRLP